MEPDDDVPLILTWDEANSGLLNEDTERRDESKFVLSSSSPSCYIDIINIIYTVQSMRPGACLLGYAECVEVTYMLITTLLIRRVLTTTF